MTSITFERGQVLGEVLWQLPWGLLEAPESEVFTSDNPILDYLVQGAPPVVSR